ncbi:hypothetical protein HP548_22850 [Paenibacillus taichungensis]|uniref:Uncharacterized protein n=2 Tax=Paenibacillus taichungensis TaxID=484184 RepID=A0ABX2MS56_9BACL|nr:hypothetical protein [Paenibacillus sp. LK1]NUU56925.1 hypothetical protein [Paenibacillus taichungensis]
MSGSLLAALLDLGVSVIFRTSGSIRITASCPTSSDTFHVKGQELVPIAGMDKNLFLFPIRVYI